MPTFPFYKFSPSGNTTLFLLGEINSLTGCYCRNALLPEGISAEQCGMVDIDNRRLEMGGGEFCANAARALGALLDMVSKPLDRSKSSQFSINISGNPYPVLLTVTGQAPHWSISATFHIGEFSLNKCAENHTLVQLSGITHLLLNDNWPAHSEIACIARDKRAQYELHKYLANGVVWWRLKDDSLEILPHIEVPAVGSSMLESSCGSASVALALALHEISGNRTYLMRQPGGESVTIDIAPDNSLATLTGSVKLCAYGELLLPECG